MVLRGLRGKHEPIPEQDREQIEGRESKRGRGARGEGLVPTTGRGTL